MLRRLRKPVMERVSEVRFREEMTPLTMEARAEIESYLNAHEKQIKRYEFGHRTGNRVFRVVLRNDEDKAWNMTRRRHHHHGIIWRLFFH